jgi:hypothetical protein
MENKHKTEVTTPPAKDEKMQVTCDADEETK